MRHLEHTNAMHSIKRKDDTWKNWVLFLLLAMLLGIGLHSVENEKIAPLSVDEVTR